MVIGIIGSSLAGLVAGKNLAMAGHEVTVIEKEHQTGGRVTSQRIEENGFSCLFDHGHSFFAAELPEFDEFVAELKEKDLLEDWARNFGYFDGTQLHQMNPNRIQKDYFAAPKGMESIAGYLARWVDLKMDEKAGGLTHIGADRTKKRSWMVNLTDISVFECDAVIIAAPAPEAYGVLQTAQDETPARKIIRVIDEVRYKSRFTLSALYDDLETPSWHGIECEDDRIELIIHESSKRNFNGKTGLVIRSTENFGRRHRETGSEEITSLMLENTAKILDAAYGQPSRTQLHYWKYDQAVNPVEEYFMELKMEEAPLALVGDYLGGNTFESAYLSGYLLAEYWIDKYQTAEVAG